MKKAAFITALFVVGTLVGGFIGLYAVLPSGTVECGDACGTRALMFAVRCGVAAGLLSAIVGVVMVNRRQVKRSTKP